MNTNAWLAVWGVLVFVIAIGITVLAVAWFPDQRGYSFLLIVAVLGVFGFFGRRFINGQATS